MTIQQINNTLGNADLFLIDQLLKGRFPERSSILDLGCGEGRNLQYFLKNNYSVWGIDQDPMAIKLVKVLARQHRPETRNMKFIQASIAQFDQLVASDQFDFVLAINVFQWLRGEEEFLCVWKKVIQVLRKGGIVLVRMAVAEQNVEVKTTNAPPFVLTSGLLENILGHQNLKTVEPPVFFRREGFLPEVFLILQKLTD